MATMKTQALLGHLQSAAEWLEEGQREQALAHLLHITDAGVLTPQLTRPINTLHTPQSPVGPVIMQLRGLIAQLRPGQATFSEVELLHQQLEQDGDWIELEAQEARTHLQHDFHLPERHAQPDALAAALPPEPEPAPAPDPFGGSLDDLFGSIGQPEATPDPTPEPAQPVLSFDFGDEAEAAPSWDTPPAEDNIAAMFASLHDDSEPEEISAAEAPVAAASTGEPSDALADFDFALGAPEPEENPLDGLDLGFEAQPPVSPPPTNERSEALADFDFALGGDSSAAAPLAAAPPDALDDLNFDFGEDSAPVSGDAPQGPSVPDLFNDDFSEEEDEGDDLLPDIGFDLESDPISPHERSTRLGDGDGDDLFPLFEEEPPKETPSADVLEIDLGLDFDDSDASEPELLLDAPAEPPPAAPDVLGDLDLGFTPPEPVNPPTPAADEELDFDFGFSPPAVEPSPNPIGEEGSPWPFDLPGAPEESEGNAQQDSDDSIPALNLGDASESSPRNTHDELAAQVSPGVRAQSAADDAFPFHWPEEAKPDEGPAAASAPSAPSPPLSPLLDFANEPEEHAPSEPAQEGAADFTRTPTPTGGNDYESTLRQLSAMSSASSPEPEVSEEEFFSIAEELSAEPSRATHTPPPEPARPTKPEAPAKRSGLPRLPGPPSLGGKLPPPPGGLRPPAPQPRRQYRGEPIGYQSNASQNPFSREEATSLSEIDPRVADPEVFILEEVIPAESEVSLYEQAREAFSEGDFGKAEELTRSFLKENPGDTDAERFLGQIERERERAQIARLGSLVETPQLKISMGEVFGMNLDHRAGYLLSQIDGMLTFEDLLDLSAMDRLETITLLADLMEQDVIELS